MKILFTCLHYGGLTGSELYASEICNELARKGHTVHVFKNPYRYDCMSGSDPLSRRNSIAG